MQKFILALATGAVVTAMCIATAMSPTAGSALARAEGGPAPVAVQDLMVSATSGAEPASD